MHVAIDFDKGTATMTTSEFWSGLNDLLAQADAHPIDSRDEDSGYLNRDRDACLVAGHLEIGKPLWPLIERDICRDATLDAKLRHAFEVRNAGRTARRQQRISTEESTPGSAVCALVVGCSLMTRMATACLIRQCGK
jgi:hypothetical protein